MGFIDYSGTKEDRYSDVLEFAKAQQEEEARRLEDEFVGKAVAKIIGDARYTTIDIGDLIKYVIVKYKTLRQMWERLDVADADDIRIDRKILWNDLCIALIDKRLEAMELTEERKIAFFKTFSGKVFKLKDAISSENHYLYMNTKPSYQRYFTDCFDLVQEKQFWKWLGRVGTQGKKDLIEFVKVYEQLSVLTGYYLFQGIRPIDHGWLQRLEVEHKALEQLSIDYGLGRLEQPNYCKLKNPLYEPVNSKEMLKTNKNVHESELIDEPLCLRKSQFDKKRFEELLKKQRLLSYVEACRLLRRCELPEKIDDSYKELIIRLPILQESIDKFEKVYQPNMYQFYEYYIPETLQLTATFIEYLNVEIGEQILRETEQNVHEATKKLLIAVNDMIDEIYKFASIEIKAKAKALESIISQDGYVDSKFKIN